MNWQAREERLARAIQQARQEHKLNPTPTTPNYRGSYPSASPSPPETKRASPEATEAPRARLDHAGRMFI